MDNIWLPSPSPLLGHLGINAWLRLENMALRHQILVLRRKQKRRVRFTALDRIFWILLFRLWPRVLDALVIVQPATVVQWHRQGFRWFWRWKSRRQKPGRKPLPKEVRDLIWRMCRENPLWGAPRIHGELLKLGYEIVQSSVAKYMVKSKKPPSQTWKAFLENHADCIVAMDFFTVPTVFFKALHVLVLLDHERRRVIHFNVSTNPTSAWVAQQIREALPWEFAPRYLIHDRDPVFRDQCKTTLKAMGIEEVITAPQSPWQNPYCERIFGSLRRECLDHVIVLNEEHLRRVLTSYLDYYHESRTHISLGKDCPNPRPTQATSDGKVVAFPCVGGLHHRYERKAA